MSKQRGALMSSKLMPPKDGAIDMTPEQMASVLWSPDTTANYRCRQFFEQHGLPSITEGPLRALGFQAKDRPIRP